MLSRRALLGLMTLALAAPTPACKSPGAQREATGGAPGEATAAVVVDTGARRVTFRVELARTEAERERGLMYRQKLDADAGMLFLFERPAMQTFWMKNTLIPLDMIFIKPDRTIAGVVEKAEPLTLSPRGVPEPTQFVLEIGGGLAAQLGIRAGQRAEFRGVDGF